jgi:hypothetical protein
VLGRCPLRLRSVMHLMKLGERQLAVRKVRVVLPAHVVTGGGLVMSDPEAPRRLADELAIGECEERADEERRPERTGERVPLPRLGPEQLVEPLEDAPLRGDVCEEDHQ